MPETAETEAETDAERIATVLQETGHASLYGAAVACDVSAVRALVAAGADADEGDIIAASANGQTEVVRQLARLGCSLYRRNMFGWAALDLARQEGHNDIVLLLTDLFWVGGWRPYAAARRMPYVRIRHEVGKTYKVLKEDHDDRALLHFVFGKSQRGSSSEHMRMLPRWLFRYVVGYLES